VGANRNIKSTRPLKVEGKYHTISHPLKAIVLIETDEIDILLLVIVIGGADYHYVMSDLPVPGTY
jgi:hypothetical protein